MEEHTLANGQKVDGRKSSIPAKEKAWPLIRMKEYVSKEFEQFKKGTAYQSRKDQLRFVEFAGKLIRKIVQSESSTTADFNAIISLTRAGYSAMRKENGLLKIENLHMAPADKDELKRLYQNVYDKDKGITGFSSNNSDTFRWLSEDSIQIVKDLLTVFISAGDNNEIEKQKGVIKEFGKIHDGASILHFSLIFYYLYPLRLR